MSKLKECIKSGDVKRIVAIYVDDYEDLFDCCVTSIGVCAIDDEGKKIDVILRNGDYEV